MPVNEWLDALGGLFRRSAEGISDRLPDIVGAVVLVALGWLGAKLLRTLTVRIMRSLDRRIPDSVLSRQLHQIGIGRDVPDLIGGLVFWIVLLFFVTAATEILGLPIASTFLGGLANYLPRVLAAALIVFVGVLAGNLARNATARAADTAGIARADLLGRLSQAAIVLVAVVIAIDQVGIEVAFLVTLLAVVIGSTFGAMAIAFGFGARSAVANMIGSHYVGRYFEVGQSIQIGEYRGRILRIESTAVLLETDAGQVFVPGKFFSEMPAIKIDGQE